MKKITLVLLLFVCTVSFAQDSLFKEPVAVIDAWIEAQLAYERLPGVTVAIVKDQQLVWSKGYGYADVENKVPMKDGSLCSICSISKLFTSIAIMQLWEQGKLRLDDSVSMYLPHFKVKQEFESVPITIRGLLTHSAGLPRETAQPYWTNPYTFPTEKEINDKLGEQNTLYPASREYQYSNLGMSLLGQIVAKVSGMPYEQYVEEKILKPLQLSNTRPRMPKELYGSQLAKGYSGVNRQGLRHLLPFFTANGVTPAAGFTSSVTDLAKFLQWQNRLLKTGKAEVLKASTLREMQRVQWFDPEGVINRGLGFVVTPRAGTMIVGHGGSCPGYKSIVQLDTKTGFGVAVFINAPDGIPGKFSDGIFKILNAYAASTRDPLPRDLSPYTGLYDPQVEWGFETAVMPWKGKLLMFSLPASDPIGARPNLIRPTTTPDQFTIDRKDDLPGKSIRFERDGSGKVVRVWVDGNYLVKDN